jgi:PAS domain S-box-containing protein
MTPLRILIIDNNAEDRLMMNRALADFIVNEAATADEGIEAAHQTNPDCILLAYGLPEIDGFAILEHLIPEPTSPQVAVVMLMGADDETIANVAIKRGAQDCLTKSCLEPRDFRRVIHSAVARVELILQRHGAEQELAASEARYRSIVEDHTEMVNRFHADGTLTFVNAPFARAFGRMPPQLIGTSLYKLVPDVERAFIRNAIAGLTPRNPVVTHRHRAFAADGSIRWQEWSNRLLPRQEGKLDEHQGTGRDITERKRAEDALQESQECIAAILTTAMDAVVAVDERQRIILFNRAAADLFRCPSEEAIGTPLDRFIPQPFRHRHAEDIRRFGETGGTVRSMGNLRALRALRADGTEIPIEASISTTKAVAARYILSFFAISPRVRRPRMLSARAKPGSGAPLKMLPLEWRVWDSMAAGLKLMVDSAKSLAIPAKNFLPQLSRTSRMKAILRPISIMRAKFWLEISHTMRWTNVIFARMAALCGSGSRWPCNVMHRERHSISFRLCATSPRERKRRTHFAQARNGSVL